MARKSPDDSSSSYLTTLTSDGFYFHLEGLFFLCVNHLPALSLGIYCLSCLEYTAPFYLLMWISMLWVESYRNSYSTSFGKRIHWRHATVSHKTIWRAGPLGLGNNWHKKFNCCLHSPVWPLCYLILPSLMQTSLSHNFLPPYVKNREPLWFTESPACVDYPTTCEALIFLLLGLVPRIGWP